MHCIALVSTVLTKSLEVKIRSSCLKFVGLKSHRGPIVQSIKTIHFILKCIVNRTEDASLSDSLSKKEGTPWGGQGEQEEGLCEDLGLCICDCEKT